ncbi:MAG: 4-alpha-glucanotransferase [Candidatus Kerfeldbacteria bacterium RIFCSPLOWO2_01_FULL_48_11]|uniref:4-alpha-glucanotransferase n=1 Tax=Candidatus Kerfeldbacteria bacterium RIFCSPLOWO2_01_FULL_48_11 TaxID=1798543 RepID=A0A1G2B4K9_9BACT|nr:MAG: 4-alpha-glucanotransferase [Parcubacteria group bacterium GW2011_GWA2_48_9]OGY83656.1 MAG: 4-alpha-glucanotransferase [Candidatus Kerfeldbacteria bacterium RIFCSPLOWO2_01_FULL_48_11]HCM68205.1 4-alpha-glucanotransferase [Candidatus Kerfeldbacteria bacterium]
MKTRRSGILLHPTSLPSPYGIGDLGPEAYAFVDFLKKAGQTLWQVLPLAIPDETGSPYASASAFAGNWFIISPEILCAQGILPEKYLPRERPVGNVHYERIIPERRQMMWEALHHFDQTATQRLHRAFETFCRTERSWIRDYALFSAFKDRCGGKPWRRWPAGIATQRPSTLRVWEKRCTDDIRLYLFAQWVFYQQWFSLKAYANRRGIQIIGDVPFFVRYDSAVVWAHPELFLLDRRRQPQAVSGVPPDYFSRRGQVWGDPQYDWEYMRGSSFHWWVQRFAHARRMYDIVRLDHFRGYCALWHITRGAKTSRNGKWVHVPGQELFSKVKNSLGDVPFIAEDLGAITDDVVALRKRFALPTTRVLQFGFGGDPNNNHSPYNVPLNAVVYTGTHDNSTARGWITKDASPLERRNALLTLKAGVSSFAWKLIVTGMRSRANVFITTIQDVLNLGNEARLNRPGTKRKNWDWRMDINALPTRLARRLHALTKSTRR